MKDKIIEMLGNGVAATDVSLALGCDISYVSQIANDDAAKTEIVKLRQERVEKYVKRDATIEGLEDAALEKLQKMLPMQTDAMKVLRIFQIMNSAKKPSTGAQMPESTGAAVVTLQLPAAITVQLKLTPDRQVIEIDGRSMVPMQSHKVKQILREKKAAALLEFNESNEKLISEGTKSIVDQL